MKQRKIQVLTHSVLDDNGGVYEGRIKSIVLTQVQAKKATWKAF